MSYFQVNEKCNGCLACVQNCPAGALRHEDRGARRILLHNMTLCARCGHCWRICPQDAVEFEHLLQSGWDEVVSMELLHCPVCGEPVYTTSFRKVLETRLGQDVETLCARHRAVLSVSAWHRATAPVHPPGEAKE